MIKIIFLITKLISKVQKISGGGTSFPGKVALRLKPDILSHFKLPQNRVFISGTNGKTSTANYLASVFDAAGYSVCHNTAGANLKQGIVTVLLTHSNSDLKLKSDTLVIEIDEISMGPIFSELDPQNLLLTNLFTDQIDRLGDKWQLAKTLSKSLPKGLNLYVNGDDPVLVWLADQIKPNKVIYYGLDSAAKSITDKMATLTEAAISKSTVPERCPYCNSELHYDFRYYESLGRFKCQCGFSSPKVDYIATDIDLNKQIFSVNDQTFSMPYSQIYLVYNMLAAITFGLDRGISANLISDVLTKQKSFAGRFEFLDFNDHQAWLNLVKNPAGINQSLDFIHKELINAEKTDQKLNLLLAFNNEFADGLDHSWLEQANFELLRSDSLSVIYLAGSLQKIVANLLVAKGIPLNKILLYEDLSISIAQMKKSNLPSYFLSNFTMLNPVRDRILKA